MCCRRLGRSWRRSACCRAAPPRRRATVKLYTQARRASAAGVWSTWANRSKTRGNTSGVMPMPSSLDKDLDRGDPAGESSRRPWPASAVNWIWRYAAGCNFGSSRGASASTGRLGPVVHDAQAHRDPPPAPRIPSPKNNWPQLQRLSAPADPPRILPRMSTFVVAHQVLDLAFDDLLLPAARPGRGPCVFTGPWRCSRAASGLHARGPATPRLCALRRLVSRNACLGHQRCLRRSSLPQRPPDGRAQPLNRTLQHTVRYLAKASMATSSPRTLVTKISSTSGGMRPAETRSPDRRSRAASSAQDEIELPSHQCSNSFAPLPESAPTPSIRTRRGDPPRVRRTVPQQHREALVREGRILHRRLLSPPKPERPLLVPGQAMGICAGQLFTAGERTPDKWRLSSGGSSRDRREKH